MMKTMKDLKPFSREWWHNYWFYYKWQTIAVAFALILLVYTIVDTITKVHPDLSVCFAGNYMLSETDYATLQERMKASITDTNGDGQNAVEFMEIYLADSETPDEMQMANQQKLYLQFAAGDSYLFVMDRALFEAYDAQELLDKDTLCVETKNCSLFEGTQLAGMDAVMVTRYQRMDKDVDFTSTRQIIEGYK